LLSYKLDISYDGTNFHGFQKQINNRTIQGEIEKILYKLLKDYDLTYSGRTDAGVHAKSQILCLKVNKPLNDNFINSFNSLISNEIKVNKILKASKEFNPRHDAKSRVYKYFILYTVEGNSFLHNMVKSIVGSQLAVIDKKISIEDLKLSLKNPSETRHRFMVPSSGLYLWKIKY
jgi:tRNA pseudouridine38-40 synthase